MTSRSTAFVLAACLLAVPEGGASAQDSEPLAEERFQQDLAWSPDGEWIAYSELANGSDYAEENWTVYVSGLDGSDRRVIAEHARGVSWSSDGLRLAYASAVDGDWEIYVHDLESGRSSPVTDNHSSDNEPAFSPVGDHIVWSAESGATRRLLVASAGDPDERTSLTQSGFSDYGPEWSPDGSRVIFYREKGDGADQIYIVDVMDGTVTAVTRDSLHHTYPSFGPGGRTTFTTMDRTTGQLSVSTSNPDGTDRDSLTLPASIERPFFARWAPDGRRVAIIAGRWPDSTMYVVDTATATVKRLIH